MSLHTARLLAATALVAAGITLAHSTANAAPIPSGWTCVGNCGSLGPNGVVTASPLGGDYQYVSTVGGLTGVGAAGLGGTNGSTLATSTFTAAAGDDLNFYFNFVTSDGAGFADYAWAQLYTASNALVAMLFTARTTPSGNTVPGFSMPAIDPNVTITPATVTIVPGGPVWSPLGSDSGRCFSTGCGYTGWVNANYEFASSGSYYLMIGVSNWSDTIWHTGFAMDGLTVAGVSVETPAPAPASLALLGLGLAGLARFRRRTA